MESPWDLDDLVMKYKQKLEQENSLNIVCCYCNSYISDIDNEYKICEKCKNYYCNKAKCGNNTIGKDLCTRCYSEEWLKSNT